MHPLSDRFSGQLAYSLRLPLATPSNNELREMHFLEYRRLRRSWCDHVAAALRFQRPASPLAKAGLHIRRHCAGGGLDWDNAYGGLKPLLDCLVAASPRNPDGLGLILNDSLDCIPVSPFLEQLAAPRSKAFTEVFIYDLSDLPS